VTDPPTAEGKRSVLLLLDTHVLLWLVSGDARLGDEANRAIESAAHSRGVLVSAITPWEVGLLAGKKKIELHQDALEWIRAVLMKPGMGLAPLEPEIAVRSTCLPFEMHADPADRILVATARHLGATLVTADKKLLELSAQGHFRGFDAGR
jgi:PIN domain nuclease of toxin-antitoxin system